MSSHCSSTELPYPPWCEEYPELRHLLVTHGIPLPVPSQPSSPIHGWEDNFSGCDSSTRPLPNSSAFGPRVLITSDTVHPWTGFDCSVCGPSSVTWGRSPQSVCGHYEPCTECLGIVIKQIMRCANCCRELTNQYPVCDENCEMVSRRLSQGLSTTKCPRCDTKLAKDGCGKGCLRRVSNSFETCHRLLQTRLVVMVWHPSVCSSQEESETLRPCSHYSRCKKHNIISRGRAHQRCPRCRDEPPK